MDPAVHRQNLNRNFSYFFYFVFIFVGIRVWVEIVNVGDQTAIVITAIITFVLLSCCIIRCRRQRALNEQGYRLDHNQQMLLFSIFQRASQHPGLNPLTGGLTQESINSLPTKIYTVSTTQPTEASLSPSTYNNHISNNSTTLTQSNTYTSLEEGKSSPQPSNTAISSSVETEIDHDHNSCSICLSDYVTEDILIDLPNCRHCYHKACISEWLELHNNCPLCKAEVIVTVPNNANNTNNNGETGAGTGVGLNQQPVLPAIPLNRLSALHHNHSNSANFYVIDGHHLHYIIANNNSSSNTGGGGYSGMARGGILYTLPPGTGNSGGNGNGDGGQAHVVNASSSGSSGGQISPLSSSPPPPQSIVYSAWGGRNTSPAPSSPSPAVVQSSAGLTIDTDSSNNNNNTANSVVGGGALVPSGSMSANSNATARHFDANRDEYFSDV